jgi:flagellar biosynthesis component FlhA
MLAWPYRHHPRKERSRLVTQLPATTPAHILSPAVVVVTTAVQHEDSSRKVLLSWFFDFMRLFPPFSDLLFLLGHLIHPTRFTLLPLYIHRTTSLPKENEETNSEREGGTTKEKKKKKNNTREWRGMKSIDNPWGIHGRRPPLLCV